VTHGARAHARQPLATPLFVRRNGRPLFAWHHPAREDVRRGAAVVLCPPLGFEHACVYRTWRVLAEQLASLGFDTFRFDYESTGDSADRPDAPGGPDAWLKSIDRVVDEARERARTSAVALVGVRLGATLALKAAAARGGVDRLVLWSPFRTGRAYLRELRALEHFSRQDYVPEPVAGPDIHAAGYTTTAATAAALETWDLHTLSTRPAKDVLLADRDDLPHDRALAACLERLGSRVTEMRLPGLGGMLVQPALCVVPQSAVDSIASWLCDWTVPALTVPAVTASSELTRARDAAISFGPGYSERALHFGADDGIFGILTVPDRVDAGAPAILLLNTGAEHHIGPNRMYVSLAREWAAKGHVVLRYDLRGIGDSPPPPGAEPNIVVPAHALDDMRAAIALVRTWAPGARIAAAGLSSGGWLAFLAAREGLALDAVVAINPPLYLRDGPAGLERLGERNDITRYQQSLRDPAKWVKAVRGGAAYFTFVRLTLVSICRRIVDGCNAVLRRRDGLERDLDRIAARGISALLVFSHGDAGLHYFGLHAKGRGRYRRSGRINHVVVDDAGHTFRPPAAQKALREILMTFTDGLRRAAGNEEVAPAAAASNTISTFRNVTGSTLIRDRSTSRPETAHIPG
jgi:alpha-beta hydrolase superfamily lysophospholipase